MTDAPAAILATFSDLRLVKSRKTAQLVFEVPMEKLKEALDALGMPDPQGDVWCGIALVRAPDAATATREDLERPNPIVERHVTKPKKRWHEMPASQRAALLCGDDEFQRYAEDMGASLDWGMSRTEGHTDRWLKKQCGVESKSELLPGTTAHATFVEIEGNFHAWRQAKQLGAA